MSGSTRLEVRVSWVLYHLKRSGAIEATEPGHVRITGYGHQLLNEHPDQLTEADLEVSPQYLDEAVGEEGSEESPVHWFVGAVFADRPGREAYDRTDQFIVEGLWRAGRPHRDSEKILSMKPGDRIAIKAAFTRKHDLPFDIGGKTAAVMSIKATAPSCET